MSVIIPNEMLGVFPIHSDPEPKSKTVTDVTNSLTAVVTTSEDHGYLTGWSVIVSVPKTYGMAIKQQQTIITVLTPTTFSTTINTTQQSPFVIPALTSFTPAQVVPESGITANYARADGRL